MIQIPRSEKIRTAAWPRDGVREFLFAVRSAGGRSMGSGIQEFDWTLEVDSRRGLVSVESFRSDGDMAGQPVGVFRYEIDDAGLREVHRLVTDARLGELRPAMKTHPGYTESLYTMTEAGRNGVRVVINNSDAVANAAIQPLSNKITALLAGSFAHPERSVQLAIAHSVLTAGDAFTVSVRNNGLEKVCFTDPRWIVASGALQKAVVLLTEFPAQRPGEPPPLKQWREIALSPLQPRPATEPLITMSPGATWKAIAPAGKLAPGMRYLAYFSWANYAGAAMVAGSYRIRGRADSPRLVFEGGKG